MKTSTRPFSASALFLAALTLPSAGLHAGQQEFNAGSQAAPWLKLSKSARYAAMGGAGAALAGGLDSQAVNPAGLARLKGQNLALQHHAYVLDSSMEHLSYGLGPKESLGLALSLDYISFGQVEKYKVDSLSGQLVQDGSMNPSGMHLDLGAGWGLGTLALGVNAKMVSQNLNGSGGTAFAADLGALWRHAGGFSLGASAQNFGSQLDGASLPAGFKLGAAYALGLGSATAILAGQADLPTADLSANVLGLGLEYAAAQGYALRAGYRAAGNEGLGGLTAGAGVAYGILGLDYAFQAMGVLGGGHQVTAKLHF